MASVREEILEKLVKNNANWLVNEKNTCGVILITFHETPEGVRGLLSAVGYKGIKSYDLLPTAKKQIEKALEMLQRKEHGLG